MPNSNIRHFFDHKGDRCAIDRTKVVAVQAATTSVWESPSDGTAGRKVAVSGAYLYTAHCLSNLESNGLFVRGDFSTVCSEIFDDVPYSTPTATD